MPPLPTFATPPVTEVALAALFRPLGELRAIDMARLRERWRSRLPEVEEHPPLPPMAEMSVPGLQIEFDAAIPLPRWWFVTADERQLVQVQRDRLVRNWRRIDGGDPYPHYAAIRPDFDRDLADFRGFVATIAGVEDLAVRLVEVTYINPIPIEAGRSWTEALSANLSSWSESGGDTFLPPPDTYSLTLRYPVTVDGRRAGSLTAAVQPGEDERMGRVMLMQMVGRIEVDDPAGMSIGAGLDLAHEWVVRGFASLTSAAAHRAWGRDD